ncbi:MAG: hypothetical protein AAGF98_03560 [Cyanobacteria bacterium P01_H01_bin.153]
MVDSNVPLLDSQSSQPPQPEQMADASAERLMHDLFDGVDRALEGDLEALDEVPSPDLAESTPAAGLNLNLAESELPAVVLNPTAAIADETTDLTTLPTQLATADNAETAATSEQASTFLLRWRQRWTMNRALLGAAGLMTLATLGLWLHQRQQANVTTTAPLSTPTDVSTTAGNSEFLEYLRRSLDVIAQSSTNTSTTAANVGEVALPLGSNGSVGLPPIANNTLPPSVPGGLPTAPGSVNVIERVYVPYPSSQTAAVPATSGASTPANGATSAAGSTTAAVPDAHTLLGVLELGDRSAALFEIEGVPQRVYIGERVGTSGWSLVSVANEEAVVRRNGEVRTLYIGQQF